jgi:hypothetical protein
LSWLWALWFAGQMDGPGVIMCVAENTMIATKAVRMSLLDEHACVDPLAVLSRFRNDFHGCLIARADALFELTEALLCTDGPVSRAAAVGDLVSVVARSGIGGRGAGGVVASVTSAGGAPRDVVAGGPGRAAAGSR